MSTLWQNLNLQLNIIWPGRWTGVENEAQVYYIEALWKIGSHYDIMYIKYQYL